jgi:hypothetical protein
MFDPIFSQELLRAREAELALKLRHAHHTAELPPTVLSATVRRVRDRLFKRESRPKIGGGPGQIGYRRRCVQDRVTPTVEDVIDEGAT